GRDPIEDFEAINEELVRYNETLASRPQIVAANKCDIVEDPEMMERFRAHVTEKGYELFEISAATHQGVRELVLAAAEKLSQLPPIQVFEPEYVEPEPQMSGSVDELTIEVEDGVYHVEGMWLDRLLDSVNFGDRESFMYLDRTLRNSGLFDRLEEMGINEGDIVALYELEFEYKK
ncbi:MAG: Obg family GTPase CgtA, partial [Oscillospiraceae bacterium]|nr:Obg family GTPase CgtA [Oscillospiraceae bacterium]